MFEDIRKHIKDNAEREGKTVPFMLLSRLPRITYSIPVFLLALLYPIDLEESNGWYSGILHGVCAPYRMLIRLFSPDTILMAPNADFTYKLCWWVFLIYGIWILLLLVVFKLNEWPWTIFSGIAKQLKQNSRYENVPLGQFLLRRIADTLSLTIPGFIFVVLFPIKAEITYDWWSGIWHGWFALCNMLIGRFSEHTLYVAKNASPAYNICWWFFFVWSIMTLFGLSIGNIFIIKKKETVRLTHPEASSGVSISGGDSLPRDLGIKTSVPNRTIKIFISSTFQDMHQERDYLMTQVFPQIQNIAQRRGVKVIPVDLRWGITEEESRSGKVLELCLQEIDNSIPFFIGIIGKRYGWKPSVEEYFKSDLLKKNYSWVEEDFRSGLSITEIEMQYGVLRRKEHINAIFFTTQGTFDAVLESGDNNKGRIANLKRQIIKDGRYPIVTIYTPQDLGNKVLELLTSYLDMYFPIEGYSSSQTGQLSDDNFVQNSKDFISEYLSKYGKKLSEQQTMWILDNPLSKNSITLKSILDELLLFGKYEQLDKYILHLLEAQTPCALYERILERAECNYGEKQVRMFFSLLRISDKSLPVKEVLDMAEVEDEEPTFDMEFSLNGLVAYIHILAQTLFNTATGQIKKKPFGEYFREYLQQDSDGRIRLEHKYMQQAVDARYLSETKAREHYKRIIHEHVMEPMSLC